MTCQRLEMMPAADIPEAYRLVVTPAGEYAPVWMKRYRSDPTAMPLQRHQTIPRPCIPYTHRLVGTP